MANVQFCRLTSESTFNTYNSGGTVTDIFLTDDSDQTVRPMPDYYKIRDSGVGNRLVRSNVGWTGVTGQLRTYLFPSQTAALLGYATTLSGSPCLDLGSFTLDHVAFVDGCSGIYRRYTGCKIASLSLKGGNSSAQDQLIAMSMDIVASTPRTITISDFPTPVYGSYPTDDPFEFYMSSTASSGTVTIGSARTNFTNWSVDFKNTVTPFRDESLYASRVTWFGRDVNLGVNLLLKSNADRANFEAGTKVSAIIELNNSVNALTMTFGLQTVYDSVGDTFPLGNYFTQQLNLTSMMDSTQSPPTDFAFTYAAD